MYPLKTPKEEQKLCSNCACSVRLFSGKGFECLADENKVGISRVDGEFIFGERDCTVQREFNNPAHATERCGLIGRWWKLKPPESATESWKQTKDSLSINFNIEDGGSIRIGKSTMEL